MSIVPANIKGEIAVSKYDDEFDKIASSKYLPRITLMGNTSQQVQDQLALPGEYLLIKNKKDFKKLGRSFDAFVFGWRPKAMKFDPKDGAFCVYNPKSAQFQTIKMDAEEDGAFDRGTSYGPEFFMWIPVERSYGTMFCNSKTGRLSSVGIKTILTDWQKNDKTPSATFKSSLREGRKFKWPGMDVYPCTTPLAPTPDWEEMKTLLAAFNNPPETDVELDEEPAGSKQAR